MPTPDPAADIQKLVTDYPIALFPVRIETRFVLGSAPKLRIRVYPDEIVADLHEPLLSAEEIDAGKAYWSESWKPADEPQAWRRLVSSYSPQRAAWIVRTLEPENYPPTAGTTPAFPNVVPRQGGRRAAKTTVLPDRWVAIAFRGDRGDQEVKRVVGNSIPESLLLSYRADLEDTSGELENRDELRVEKALLWAIDFDRALADGMALTMDLSATDVEKGFKRLLVIGVKTTIAPQMGSDLLGSLLDAHHYTRGLALVPQGTCTNNSSEGAAGYPPPDDATRSYGIERGQSLVAREPDGEIPDGEILAKALGVKLDILAHVEGSNRKEQVAAQAMSQALWPSTLGYYLDQMMSPLLTATQVQEVREHFEAEVRGRGPYPAFRVGRVPYGLLPATSIKIGPGGGPGPTGPSGPLAGGASARTAPPAGAAADPVPRSIDGRSSGELEPATASPSSITASTVPTGGAPGPTGLGDLGFTVTPEMLLERMVQPALRAVTSSVIDVKLPAMLKVWRGLFLERVPFLARVGKPDSVDPDKDLLAVLAVDASSREVRVREAVGIAYLANVFRLLRLDLGHLNDVRRLLIEPVLTKAGIPIGALTPRLTGLTWADKALRVSRPLVTKDALSETEGLSDKYIAKLRESTIEELRAAGQKSSTAFQNPLLFHMLRQGALLEYARIGINAALPHGAAVPHDRTEVEFFHIAPGTLTRKTHWDRFAAPVAGLTNKPLGEWLLESSPEVKTYHGALKRLEGLPTAELERLFTETLDTCSHRLDAWITSIASRRLRVMRSSQPEGVHLGAFAWVENLHPRPPSTPQTTKGGFIHAPSASHAATAAILRSAHLTRTGAVRDRVTVDLSSRRVRQALALLDGVREGQPVGALLGYRFERLLHDKKLDRYIAPFRKEYPLGAHPNAPPPADASERLAARDVVNALRLREVVVGAPSDQALWTVLSFVASADQVKVKTCLDALDSDVDAAADLLVAESVYQAVQGNVDRASATLASMAGKGHVPEPQIAKTPTSGTSFTQRVAVLLGSPPTGAPGWAATPRRQAEPRLDAWLGQLLGDPAKVRCRVSFPDPTPADPTRRKEVPVSLANLGLAPLDILALARRTGPAGAGELDARIRWYAHQHPQIAAPLDAQIEHQRSAASPFAEITFPEFLEVARLLGEVVRGARPLVPADLQRPGSEEAGAVLNEEEVAARAAAAANTLASVRTMLSNQIAQVATAPATSLTGLRSALWSATAIGVQEAVPVSLGGEDASVREALLAQATSVRDELDRRLAAADPQVATTGRERLHAIFGPTFPVLPTFTLGPASRTEFEAARNPGPSLGNDPHAPRRWFERAARVRSPLSHLRLATQASEAVTGQRFDLSVAQLPHVAGKPWIALPFQRSDPNQWPQAGTLSIALRRELTFPAPAWAGLLLDEWAEVIPDEKQTTALAVHHDSPGAEAPQCVLMAVPPATNQAWNLENLISIVQEALDLAQIRAVDSDQLGSLALLAPCIYVAANVADDTIALNLGAMRIKETRILPAE